VWAVFSGLTDAEDTPLLRHPLSTPFCYHAYMRDRKRPRADQLSIPQTARFLVLTRALSKAAVRTLFDEVLQETEAKRVAEEIRISHGVGDDRYVHSFLCFRTNPMVSFLAGFELEEVRYGFVLLIERRGHLIVFHRLAAGLDNPVASKGRPVDRRRLTHIWADRARYQKLSTRRMTIARQELRGASYEADDLETALGPAMAARSILRSVRLATPRGVVGITPSTGRIRVSAGRAGLAQLVRFIDETLTGIETPTDSPFLNAFPESVGLEDLPGDVQPTGLLFDLAVLQDLLDDPTAGTTLRGTSADHTVDTMLEALSGVLNLRTADEGWEGVDAEDNVVAQVRRLKRSYSAHAEIAQNFSIETEDGVAARLDRWLRDRAAFSLTFSSPDFFYADNRLHRRAGFAQEVRLVRRMFEVHRPLEAAQSEKGGDYPVTATRFAEDSIFAILETSLAEHDAYVWCCDLGDEWADYIGVGPSGVTFYHCKHGAASRGATALQIVTAQALKNLARVKFRREEVRAKIVASSRRQHWGRTHIPLLARGDDGWEALQQALLDAVADPTTRWRVALVVTALSLEAYDAEAARADATPHFIQLVWLLSAFASACRERDAQPVVYCLP
jgi:hypothetical protein